MCTGWFAEGKIRDTLPKSKLPQLNLSSAAGLPTHSEAALASVTVLKEYVVMRSRHSSSSWGKLTFQRTFPSHPPSHQTWSAEVPSCSWMCLQHIHHCCQGMSKHDTFSVLSYLDGSVSQIPHVCSSIILRVKSMCWLCIVLIVTQEWTRGSVIHWGIMSPSSLPLKNYPVRWLQQ